jgi:hypothetical protein
MEVSRPRLLVAALTLAAALAAVYYIGRAPAARTIDGSAHASSALMSTPFVPIATAGWKRGWHAISLGGALSLLAPHELDRLLASPHTTVDSWFKVRV